MKRMLLTLFLIVAAASSFGQPFFNRQYTLHSFSSQLRALIVDNNKYYSIGYGIDSLNVQGDGTVNPTLGLKFAVFDEWGNKLADKTWQLAGHQLEATSRAFYRLQDGTFIYGANDRNSEGSRSLMLVAFDSAGNHLWHRTYQNAALKGTGFLHMADLQQSPSGDWLMLAIVGAMAAGQYHSDMLLTKLDARFNVIWQKHYGASGFNEVSGRLLVDEHGYLLAGGQNNELQVTSGFTSQALLVRLDTAGGLQWTWHSDIRQLAGYISDVVATPDAGYAFCTPGSGMEQTDPEGHAVISWRTVMLRKIAADGTLQWSDSFAAPGGTGHSGEWQILQDDKTGNLLLAGSLTSGTGNTSANTGTGAMIQVNALGRVLWQRSYSPRPDGLQYIIHDIKPTSDGGYVLAGETRDLREYHRMPRQQAWLLKVDRQGLIPDGGVAESQLRSNDTPSCYVYPNPATDVLYVVFPATARNVRLSIYTIAGQEVTGVQMQGSGSVNINQLQAGTYRYQLTEGATIIGAGKLTKL